MPVQKEILKGKMGGIKNTLRFLLISSALLPIISWGQVPYPSINGKTLFLRLVLSIVLALMAWLGFTDSEYRTELLGRVRGLWKMPLTKAVTVSYVLLLVSTYGAFDRFIAFYGAADRAEGFVGLSFFYLCYFLFALVFRKRDWNSFFTVTLISGWMLFFVEIVQAMEGVARPASLMDNPIYLAGYFLLVAFAGIQVARDAHATKKPILKATGVLSTCMAVLGIFITQTRGVMAGLVVGAVVALAYLVVEGKGIQYGRLRVRVVAAWLLGVIVAFAAVFLLTIHAPVWKDVPGVNRIATFSFKDDTTLSRGVTTEIAIHAVNPSIVGVRRMLTGWGWDNYIYAWERFYVPKLYGYDSSRFDRPHDKLLDMLNMTGVLGLLAYLAIWIFFIHLIFKIGKKDRIGCAALLVWALAFFVQNLTAFDTLVTFVSFFVMLAYVGYLSGFEADMKQQASASYAIPIILSVVAIASFWAFIAWTFVPYLQMSEFRSEIQESWSFDSTSLLSPFVFSPDTYAQGTIRNDLINTLFKAYNNGQIQKPSPFLDKAIAEMEDYLSKHPYLYDDQMVLAKAYDVQSALHSDPSYLKLAEQHYLAALALIPGRQTVIYPYAINLAQQHRTEEAAALLQGLIQKDPQIKDSEYILGEVYALDDAHYAHEGLDHFEVALNAGVDLNRRLTVQAYKNYLSDFYKANDTSRFVIVAKRLAQLDSVNATAYDELAHEAETTGRIPAVDFSSVN